MRHKRTGEVRRPAPGRAQHGQSRHTERGPGPGGTASLTSLPGRALLAYECPAAAVACYYPGINGTGGSWVQWDCGFVGLGGSGVMDNVHSLKNQRGSAASLYNWTGHGYELKGWVVGANTGNFPDNVGADVANVFC